MQMRFASFCSRLRLNLLEVFLVLISWNWNQTALVFLWLLCGFSCHQNKSKVTFNKKRGKSIFVIVFSLITLWPFKLKSCQLKRKKRIWNFINIRKWSFIITIISSSLKKNVETNFEGFWKQNEKESFLTKRKRNNFIDHILKKNFILKNFRKNIKAWRRKIVQIRQNFKT
jgi:hypothetical protein